jgi:hypothetical protein
MGGTKRYPVRIKGPFGPFVGMDEDDLAEVLMGEMDEVREEEWELTDEEAARFVHEDGHAYAMTVFKEGAPQLYLTRKEVWEDPESFAGVLNDATLSPEQKTGGVQRLIMDRRRGSNHTAPPTDEAVVRPVDIVRPGDRRGAYWVSAVSLLYPALAAAWLWRFAGREADHGGQAAVFGTIGYGIANLGYLLGFAGIVFGQFPVFRLRGRGRTLAVAFVLWLAGTLVANLGFWFRAGTRETGGNWGQLPISTGAVVSPNRPGIEIRHLVRISPSTSLRFHSGQALRAHRRPFEFLRVNKLLANERGKRSARQSGK